MENCRHAKNGMEQEWNEEAKGTEPGTEVQNKGIKMQNRIVEMQN